MKEVIADQHYYYDAEGKVTTDEAKGVRWLAREGAAVAPEHQEALSAFNTASTSGKVAQAEESAEESVEKADKPKANKAEAPPKNKGVK